LHNQLAIIVVRGAAADFAELLRKVCVAVSHGGYGETIKPLRRFEQQPAPLAQTH
jgi:hypothetical protein